MPAVILSPHLDDAVLSCWHLLTQPGEVLVINVFAGIPASSDGPAWWDRFTGATDSAKRVHERLEEDRRALALAGRTAVSLGFLDEQYRQREQPLTPLTKRIERHVAPGARIYAPAAFANHTDHVLVRAAAVELRAAGFAVSFYADLPHASLHGWPDWVMSGDAPAAHDLAGAMWDGALARTGIPPQRMTTAVHELDAGALALKLAAVHAYRSQLDGLEEFAGRQLTDPETLGYEVVWTTSSPAREGGSAASRP